MYSKTQISTAVKRPTLCSIPFRAHFRLEWDVEPESPKFGWIWSQVSNPVTICSRTSHYSVALISAVFLRGFIFRRTPSVFDLRDDMEQHWHQQYTVNFPLPINCHLHDIVRVSSKRFPTHTYHFLFKCPVKVLSLWQILYPATHATSIVSIDSPFSNLLISIHNRPSVQMMIVWPMSQRFPIPPQLHGPQQTACRWSSCGTSTDIL